jgi:hypothetical protein
MVRSGIAVFQPSSSSSSSKNPPADPKGKRPARGRAGHANEPHLDCAICFDSHPASSMLAATLPAQMASSSSSGGKCGHYFCRECMRRYACEQVQVRLKHSQLARGTAQRFLIGSNCMGLHGCSCLRTGPGELEGSK